MKGKFIVICGTDGSGKGTQVNLLAKRLQEEGYKVKITDFPQYGNPSAAMVTEYLNGKFGSANEVGPYRASIFYACDRYAASFEMKKWLDDGGIIISNRYVSANKGHQLGKIKYPAERDKYLAWLDNLEYNIFGIPKEDVNFLLFVPPEIGQKLVDEKEVRTYTEKKRDIHEADLQHLVDAADAYMYVAKKENWEIVDCTKDDKILSIEEIHKMVYDRVKIVLDSKSSLKIYFAGSIRAGRDDVKFYSDIISHLKKYGDVLTEHVGMVDVFEMEKDFTDDYIHNKDIELLHSCDVVVAEVSTPSLGVGYEIAKALDQKKKVICLFRKNSDKKLSAMIAGCKDIDIIYYESLEDIKNKLSNLL